MAKATTPTPTTTPISTIQKQVGKILMLAAESDGARFLVLDGSFEFFVPASHANYAAMFSLLLAVQSAGHPVAVKYRSDSVAQLGNRRTVTALAWGTHAVILGPSF